LSTAEICDVLRGAMVNGTINAWSAPMPGVFYVQPVDGPTKHWDWKDAHDYAEMLVASGVKPRPIKWPE